MVVIASKTGWTERHILYDLPLSKGFAYYHAARVLEGERCRWPGRRGPIGRWIEQVKQWVRAAKRPGAD